MTEERGFHHPDHGYWETIMPPDAATLSGYPEGTVEVPLRPGGPDWDWTGSAWVRAPQPDGIEQARAGMACSRFQLKAALLKQGILEMADAVIARSGSVTQLAWVEADRFTRDSPTVAAVAQALGLSDEQVDDLFASAMQISV